jgi:hypothetical protein
VRVTCIAVLVVAAGCTPAVAPDGSQPVPSSSAIPTTTVPTSTTTSAPVIPVTGTVLSIEGERFMVDDEPANAGTAAEGLLLNSRMIQAIIDVEGNSSRFAYPDTGRWDPERNLAEFLAALPAYAGRGLDAVTVGLQGGNPLDAPVQDRPPWVISAYGSDGNPKPEWLDRLRRVLEETDRLGMVVIVSLFYFGQDHRLADEQAVVQAVDAVTDWIVASGYRNVIVEVANEANVMYDHAILRPDRVHELVERVTSRSGGLIPVGASMSGGRIPPDSLIRASTVILVHGNRQDADGITDMVDRIRSREAFRVAPKPILFNEDSTSLDNLRAAIAAGASWGYHDKVGFQVPPIDWSVSTPEKIAFFAEVARLTR